MTIEQGDEVQLDYVGRLADGTVFDTSLEDPIETGSAIPDRPSPPLSLEIGAERLVRGPGRIVEELEEPLLGLSEGESVTVTVPPERAYGEAADRKVVSIDREELGGMMGEDVTADEPREGLTVRRPDGQVGEIVAVDPDSVRIDFNHRLAGESLEFEVVVRAVD